MRKSVVHTGRNSSVDSKKISIFHAGETLVETMFSLAIISVTFLFLTGAVVAAIRTNDKIRNSGSEFQTGEKLRSDEQPYVTVKIESNDGIAYDEPISMNIDIYQSEKNGYYYYRVDTANPYGSVENADG